MAVSQSLFEAWRGGTARSFFGPDPWDPRARVQAVRRAARPLAPPVAGAVAAQNAALGESPARDANVEALRRGAAAVVTGQQVGLFLGPLFTIYKAATAIRVARSLAEESGTTVVPVFWLQTEDHDLPEIATCAAPRTSCGLLETCMPASPTERVSVAHRRLTDDIDTCHAMLRAELGGLPEAEAHLSRLERHYAPGRGWADAFAGVLAELFAEEGLVFVQPRDPALAGAMAPVHHRALVHADLLSSALLDRVSALETAGFKAAVHVRPGSPLSFFHPEGPEGPRFRLAAQDGVFVEIGGERRHTREDLAERLAVEPLSFSTSALLRPIVQDSLLPTAAYVGGPGEIAYFAQLAPLYAAYDLPMPLIVPRARFRVMEERTSRLLQKLGLEANEVHLPEDELLAKSGGGDGAPDLEGALLAPFEATLGGLSPTLSVLGNGVDTALEKTRATVRMAVSKLAEKVEKARLRQDQGRVEDIARLKALLLPAGQPQERVFGLPYFAARYGERRFLDAVLGAIDWLDASPKDLRP